MRCVRFVSVYTTPNRFDCCLCCMDIPPCRTSGKWISMRALWSFVCLASICLAVTTLRTAHTWNLQRYRHTLYPRIVFHLGNEWLICGSIRLKIKPKSLNSKYSGIIWGKLHWNWVKNIVRANHIPVAYTEIAIGLKIFLFFFFSGRKRCKYDKSSTAQRNAYTTHSIGSVHRLWMRKRNGYNLNRVTEFTGPIDAERVHQTVCTTNPYRRVVFHQK